MLNSDCQEFDKWMSLILIAKSGERCFGGLTVTMAIGFIPTKQSLRGCLNTGELNIIIKEC